MRITLLTYCLLVSVLSFAQNIVQELKGNSKGLSFRITEDYSDESVQIFKVILSDSNLVQEFTLIESGLYVLNVDHSAGFNHYILKVDGVEVDDIRYHHQYFNHIYPTGYVKTKWIVFQHESDYLIIDAIDEEVMSGYEDSINISSLPRGEYTIKVNNIKEKFFKHQ